MALLYALGSNFRHFVEFSHILSNTVGFRWGDSKFWGNFGGLFYKVGRGYPARGTKLIILVLFLEIFGDPYPHGMTFSAIFGGKRVFIFPNLPFWCWTLTKLSIFAKKWSPLVPFGPPQCRPCCTLPDAAAVAVHLATFEFPRES